MPSANGEVKITPLGAGREVGRSCVLICIGDVMIMADCGMHMGYTNHKQFPDFSMVAQGDLTGKIDVVLLTHFHLDHSGALPFFTERVGYSGPLIMSGPTKGMVPLLLQDFWKISSLNGSKVWEEEDVARCMEKATVINLHETIALPKNIKITAFYAGHVLGATMFLIDVNGTTVLYTGDYNTTSDRHLKGAYIPQGIHPDVVISESTYGSTIRDAKRHRERDYLTLIHETVSRGGKVLIPVFAMGRAQELLILVEAFWKRMKLKVPVYFSRGMVARANDYYRLYTNWASEAVVGSSENAFAFSNVDVFHNDLFTSDQPMVLFSTPGMLHAGNSLRAFTHWCSDPKNTVILPGYCVEGTIGHQVLVNETPKVTVNDVEYHVRCKVASLPFSAHSDARGILKLIQNANPAHVVLVHGDYEKAMLPLQRKIQTETTSECHCPANGSTLTLNINRDVPVLVQVPMGDVPIVHGSARTALGELAGFAEECAERLAKRGKTLHSDERWWEKWGVKIGGRELRGPCDDDCGCSIEEWEGVVKKMVLGKCKGKFPSLGGDGLLGPPQDPIEYPDLTAIASSPTGSTFHLTVTNETPHTPLDITFTAPLPLTPLPTPPPSPSTLLESVTHTLSRCIPQATFALTPEGVIETKGSSVQLVAHGDSRLDLTWRYEDSSLAVRVYEVVADSTGVAF
eukprot:TRINITY_DN4373_c0_g1_i1.p1 TRINITY_DN4373_c0_g1~~TRINITY_DN4373_c0_g1_i1.p1  ORF type:complete len:685 (+),score=194.94 TRINITY_DN4373_c0_g1_i1:1156-3210(+)